MGGAAARGAAVGGAAAGGAAAGVGNMDDRMALMREKDEQQDDVLSV